ncbi:uncharacterized protein LOC100201671 [Hydra vulgaris]|uniref:uncharacterized protein LOC100201671 n=1 Tax=Hydra vulgaris TaxID=6087 RepID=UPI000640FDB4|nr:uncharacterized protein LOC100201671 [Hydra vulgaris]
MIWITFVLLLTLEIKKSSTQEYTEVLSLKNFEVKKGEKVATLLFLSKSFKIDFEFCFTTVGENNNPKKHRTALFRVGPSSPDTCDSKCELMQICKSKYLYAYFEHTKKKGINMILGNCLTGYYKENYLSVNPGCMQFQITQFPVNGTYLSTIKVNNGQLSKFQNKHPEEYQLVDILFSDDEYVSQHGVVTYLSVSNADCCTLSEWTSWGKCSSTCKNVLSVPQQKRIRKCLDRGSNCKGELIEQFQNCNELFFCTGYSEVLSEKTFEVEKGKKWDKVVFLSKSFEINFEFCFTTENNNLEQSLTNLFRIGEKIYGYETCESKYLTAFFGPAKAKGINLKFGQCLSGTYSEKDLSINPGCIRFQIAQRSVKEYYQSIIKVDDVELFNFQNRNPKDLLNVYILFSDDNYASQPGIVKYLNVANADCCTLSNWREWSECSHTCQPDFTVPYQTRRRGCLDTSLSDTCYADSMKEFKNCNEFPCPGINLRTIS